MKIPSNVVVKTGPLPGKTVAIFCGVHGNERAGIMAVDRLLDELVLISGTVYFVYANPPAIEQNVRLVDVNLNRLFVRTEGASSLYEHQRAAELMDLLDECDALLDLHSYRAPLLLERATPFAICEAPSMNVARLFDVPFVINGFSDTQDGGSDGYMYRNGKIGICVELGALECPEAFVELGMETVRRFLAAFGCIEGSSEGSAVASFEPTDSAVRLQTQLHLTKMHKKTLEPFTFAQDFRSFDRINAGELIATEGASSIFAVEDAYILFPNANDPIGIEAFLLAQGS